VGIALLMDTVGLSPALGTFLAGVVLAESEYRHELEGDIEPFKGLLLGLFFISVGAQIDFGLVRAAPLTIVGLVVGVVTLKAAILYGLAVAFRLDPASRWLFALGLAQVGEFAFVLLSFGEQQGVLVPAVSGPMLAVVALSMAITPLGFVLLERVILPRVTATVGQRVHDEVESSEHPVVIAGFGRYGQVVGRILKANGIGATVLDLDSNMVDVLRRLGHRVYYGDASRPELLHAAGCAHAKVFVLAVDDPEQGVLIAKTVKHEFPHLKIVARARNRPHHYELRALGIEHITRETVASAVESATRTLQYVGFRAHTAHRMARLWREHDERLIEDLAALWGGDQNTYFAAARRASEEAERLIQAEAPRVYADADAAWDNEVLRSEDARSDERG
jgi:voltage-gated potassium channel Kch